MCVLSIVFLINSGDHCLFVIHFEYLVFQMTQAQYLKHVEEMEAVRAGMPVACVNHGQDTGGPTIRDIHLDNFSVSVGGRELIVDGEVTLSFGRHYGTFLPRHIMCPYLILLTARD
jgi:hypothetical protein